MTITEKHYAILDSKHLLKEMLEGVDSLEIILKMIDDPTKAATVQSMVDEAQANCDLLARKIGIAERQLMLRSLSRRLTAEEQIESDRLDRMVEASSDSEVEG